MTLFVMPANAGIQVFQFELNDAWIPFRVPPE
jgi:hypothetical protein